MNEQMPSLTVTHDPMLRRNLDRFLEHTAPSVQCRDPLQGSSCPGGSCDAWKNHCKSMPYFNLGDLWMLFDEWSAYGVGVPLVSPCGQTVVQYYVPYLSAIQIYVQTVCSVSPNKRRQGDDSDWSEVSDGRETSSDTGSDSETGALRINCDQWESFERLSSDSISDEQGDQQSDLLFEYFERGSPYNRAPLTGKIRELAADLPHLLTLNSNELLPASWFSVAWYPIYRIPMGRTMNDSSTCFLTFHTLWTPPCSPGQVLAGDLSKEISTSYEHIDNLPMLGAEQQTRKEQERWLREHSVWRLKQKLTLEMHAFGLASYKLGGPFWEFAGAEDKHRLALLATSADEWLRQLRVHHPDFAFFASREGLRV